MFWLLTRLPETLPPERRRPFRLARLAEAVAEVEGLRAGEGRLGAGATAPGDVAAVANAAGLRVTTSTPDLAFSSGQFGISCG